MSALEQSLDAIISQNKPAGKKPIRRTVKGGKRPQVTPKSFTNKRNFINRRPNVPAALSRKLPLGPKSKAPVKPTTATSLDVATKVIVSGLPKDIDYQTIKVCYYYY